jgi:predicted chitinase
MELTLPQALFVLHTAAPSRTKEYLPYFNAALKEGGVDTPRRLAMFLAQTAHESCQWKYLVEIDDGRGFAHYDIRFNRRLARRLGNLLPGEGSLYRGRGALQITGKANYKIIGEMLGLALVEHPDLAALPQAAFRVSAAYWKLHPALNAAADIEDVESATRIINGGVAGLDSRQTFYDLARIALDC